VCAEHPFSADKTFLSLIINEDACRHSISINETGIPFLVDIPDLLVLDTRDVFDDCGIDCPCNTKPTTNP
jgi:hypothetical protein